MMSHRYVAKTFDLRGLHGISDRTLEMHLRLYEGYVNETNRLNERIREFLRDGKVDQEEMPEYSELTRRLGFEHNGMVLHELYFANLTRGGNPDPPRASAFARTAAASFGSYEVWKADFVSVGQIRGVGWAICSADPATGGLANNWITLHDVGNVAGVVPLLVMDVWEHAFVLDYKPKDRPKYIEAFLANVSWQTVEQRLVGSADRNSRRRRRSPEECDAAR